MKTRRKKTSFIKTSYARVVNPIQFVLTTQVDHHLVKLVLTSLFPPINDAEGKIKSKRENIYILIKSP